MKTATSQANRWTLIRHGLVLACLMVSIIGVMPEPRPDAWGGETAPAGGDIGPDAVWQPEGTAIRRIGEACPEGGTCFVEAMAQSGASPAAVQFTRLLMDHDFPFCFMRSFQELGKVDMTRVDCPFMANTMGFTLLVNGSPRILKLGDPLYLRALDLRKDVRFTSIFRRYPQAEIWPDGAFVKRVPGPDGGQRFIWKHKLLNGCRACEFAGSATVAYDFDREGRYRGVKLLRLQGN